MGICRICWKHVNEFHEFYETIENIHKCLQYNDNSKPLQINAHGTIKHTDNGNDNAHFDDKCNDKIDQNNDYLLIKCESNNFSFMNTAANENESNQIEIENIKLENILNVGIEKEINVTNVMPVTNIDPGKSASPSIHIVNNKQKNYRKKPYNTRAKSTKSTNSVAKKKKTKSVSNKRCDVTNKDDTTPNSFTEISYIKDEIDSSNSDNNCNEVVYIHKKNRKNKNLLIQTIEEEDIKIREFYNLNCQKCSIKLSTITALKTHYNEEHKLKNGYVLCCNTKLFNRSNLLSHMRWHTNPNEFQ